MANKKYSDIEITTSSKSVLEGREKRLIELINGDKPMTEEDKRLVEQIKEIEKNNRIVEIPSDF
jgi:hypothetical protein